MNIARGWSAPARDLPEKAITIEWTPLIDISEDEAEYRIEAELPDVEKRTIKITLENSTLTISGERTFAFKRQFTVPSDAGDNVRAHLKDGILRVHLPKSSVPESGPDGIKVG